MNNDKQVIYAVIDREDYELSYKQAGDILGVGERTIRRYVNDSDAPYTLTSKEVFEEGKDGKMQKHKRISRGEVSEILADRVSGQNSGLSGQSKDTGGGQADNLGEDTVLPELRDKQALGILSLLTASQAHTGALAETVKNQSKQIQELNNKKEELSDELMGVKFQEGSWAEKQKILDSFRQKVVVEKGRSTKMETENKKLNQKLENSTEIIELGKTQLSKIKAQRTLLAGGVILMLAVLTGLGIVAFR